MFCFDLPVAPQLHVAADLDPEYCWLAGGVVQASPALADVSRVQQCGRGVLYYAPAVDVSEPVQNIVSTICSEKRDTLRDHGTFIFKGLNKGTTILQNIKDHSRNNTVSHPTRVKSSAELLQQPQILHKYLTQLCNLCVSFSVLKTFTEHEGWSLYTQKGTTGP